MTTIMVCRNGDAVAYFTSRKDADEYAQRLVGEGWGDVTVSAVTIERKPDPPVLLWESAPGLRR